MPPRTRRPALIVCAYVLFAVAALGGTFTASAATQESGVAEKVGDGVYVFRYGTYRSLFVVTSEGVIVTDPLNEAAARLYRAEIAKITDQPVKYVIYSHSHWDRVSGGQIFKDEGAQFVAQQGCKENLADIAARTPLRVPPIVTPDTTFADSIKIELGGKSLELFYFGPSHDTCFAVMVVEPVNMLYMAELISTLGAAMPVEEPTMAHLEARSLIPFFKSVEQLAKDRNINTVIGGHAHVLSTRDGEKLEPLTAPVAVIAAQREFWQDTIDYIEKLSAQGAQSVFLDRVIDVKRYKNYVGYSAEAVYLMLRRMITWVVTG